MRGFHVIPRERLADPSRRRLIIGTGVALLVALILSRVVCFPAWIRYGVLVGRCPDGKLQQTVSFKCQGLRRGSEGTVWIGAIANYTTAEADVHLTANVRRFDPTLVLVKPKGEEVLLTPKKGWQGTPDDGRTGPIELDPNLPDGDYVLRAKVHSQLGDSSTDLALPIYAPARIHVITDRPLYEPGNTVQFRAVVLKATDFSPIDGRPGRWIVEDPSGEVVLEEKAQAGEFGVVAGSFPIDAGARTGDWKVKWRSGTAEDVVTFHVEPFTVPRFRVEASASKPFYAPGDRPVMRGKVVYSSGAPVRGANVEITWSVQGDWPAPTEWQEGELPKTARPGANGAFELSLPVIPKDLRGRVTLHANLAAIDPAGDRVEGRASALLSEHAIEVSAVTELDDGLVQSFNNRLYLRATTAAGTVLAKTELLVKRAWEPNDKGIATTTDEDGVASLQIDPGPPANVIVPPMPVRRPPREPAITRGDTEELISGGEASLGDQLTMDRWNTTLAPCARFVDDPSEDVTIGLRVSPAGAITAKATDDEALPLCLARALTSLRLPPGRERLYRIAYSLQSDMPRITTNAEATQEVPQDFAAAIATAALDARSCLPRTVEPARLPRVLLWTAKPPKHRMTISFAPDPEKEGKPIASSIVGCVERVFARQSWPAAELATSTEFLGAVHLAVRPNATDEKADPQATTLIGYELNVSAHAPGAPKQIGSTNLVVRPGKVPPARLRASPVLAEAGRQIEVSLLRGPGFEGKLPKSLWMTHPNMKNLEGPVDEATHVARFTLPADAKGWFQVTWNDARALVYARPKTELTVSIQSDAERYAPGKTATLKLRTSEGSHGIRAAVGLFGVDTSLEQLAPLPGPDDMARVRPRPQMRSPAFGALDVAAVEMGRIRGVHAATATILRVSTLPDATTTDATVSAETAAAFDPLEALTDHFYAILGELHARVRAWETSAPKGEQMKPATMAKLWTQALEECDKRKEPVTDAYGRRLQLHRLPRDLLALTDPRAVVANGTRLPEDVESWSAWVDKEKP